MSRWQNFWQLDIWQPPGFSGYKVAAVVIAILIWGYVIFTQSTLTDTLYTVPLQTRNLDAELTVVDNDNQIQVRVQGSNADINNLTNSDIIAYVDLQGVKEGTVTLEVHIDVPNNVEVVSLIPNTITLEIAEIHTTTFPLEIEIIGTPAESFVFLDAVASPSQITLAGAEEHINNVAKVIVTADVSDQNTNYNKNLQVAVLDHDGQDISEHFNITPSTVSLFVPIVSDLPSKNMAVVASIIGAPADGYQINRIITEPSTVEAFGQFEDLVDIAYLETEPIDITGSEQTYTQTVKIIHEDNISLAVETVTVVIQIEAVSTATFARDLIYAQNLAADLACTPPTLDMTVVVSGPKSALDALNENEVVPYVDCSEISSPGEYMLPLQVNLPANISLVSIDPYEVMITVEVAQAQ